MRTHWTPEKIEEIRSMAHLSEAEAAQRLGVTVGAVHSQLGRMRRSGLPPHAPNPGDDPALRARWGVMLPRLREGVRAAVREVLR